jgi:hypothetical protein
MKPLQPAGLASFLAAGAVLGLTAAQLATGLGYSFPLSPWSMILMLPLIGVAIYLATLPIYRYRKSLEKWESGPRPSRPNPFFRIQGIGYLSGNRPHRGIICRLVLGRTHLAG